jgi:Cu/Ag efflux protein CusF
MGKLGSLITLVVLALTLALGGLALAGETLGKIQAINPMTKEVLLDNGSALAVDQDTKIMVEGKEGSLEDLKAGDEVRASFQEKDGKNIATNLDVSESAQAGMGSHGSMGTQSSPAYPGSQGSMGSQSGSSTQGGQSGQTQ